MRLPEAFKPLSSKVDWCEPNYQVTPYITEFVNTVSNLPLVVFPIVQYCLYLRFAGQLLDENGILWSLMWLSAGYWPKHLLPFGIKSRSKFTLCYIFVAFCCTVMSISAPEFNQFALIVFGIPFLFTVMTDYFSYRTPTEIYRSCFPKFILGFVLAFFVWTLDKTFCPLWRSLYIPYLHGIWHIMTAYASAYGIVLCIHEDLTTGGYPLEKIHMRYKPSWLGTLGVPYIQFSPL
ncbi:alkaline ceramidase 2-like isoform X2 [Convolutriloba macropyga]|uniref:alkaline ceramidase 2-like isoform X2 n=1 Tax=Convolutriloba macropyga TaxID=536237 RepID=UPI003F51ACBD